MSVSCQVFDYFERAADRGLVDLDQLLQGFPYDLAYLRDPDHRIHWDLWALLCNRFGDLAGDDALESNIAVLSDRRIPLGIQRLTPLIADPTLLYEVGFEYFASSIYPDVQISCDRRSTRVLAIEATIPEPLRGSRAWMVMFRAAMATMPNFIELPNAIVVEEVLTDRRWRGLVTPPAPRTLWWRASRVLSALASSRSLIDALDAQQAQVRGSLAALAEAERAYQATLDAIPAGVALHRNGVLLWVNQALHRLLPVPRPPGGIDLRDLLPDHTDVVERLLAGTATADLTVAGRSLELFSLPGPLFHQAPSSLLFVLDHTLRAEAEARAAEAAQQLASSEKLASIGRMAAAAAHEINNPLTYLQANLSFLEEELQATTEGVPLDLASAEQLIADARDGAERIGRLVTDMRGLSRAGSASHVRVSLTDVVERAVKSVAASVGDQAEIVTELDGDIPDIVGDRHQLVQVIGNLVTNASHAIAECPPADRRIRVRLTTAGPHAVLECIDRGHGMSDEVLHDAFEPFFTTKGGQGTGLGLSIVHRIVADHGGRIELDSAVGTGTTVRILLPAGDGPEAPPSLPPTPLPRERLRILIVDDEAPVRRALARLLGPFEVTTAASGREALEAIDESLPDLILCDVMMPGMTGAELYQRLADDGRGLHERLAFVTGGAFSDQTAAFLERTHRPVLHKPLDAEKLVRFVLRHADLGDDDS